jgi:hypothetical protein
MTWHICTCLVKSACGGVYLHLTLNVNIYDRPYLHMTGHIRELQVFL